MVQLSLLAVVMFTQLNMVGRHYYTSSVATAYTKKDHEHTVTVGMQSWLDMDVERDFLSMSWWLVQGDGSKLLHEHVQSVVEGVFKHYSLKQLLSMDEFSEALDMVRMELEQEGWMSRVKEWMFPSTPRTQLYTLRHVNDHAKEIPPRLQGLMDEMLDLVDSPDMESVVKACLNRMFAMMRANLRQQVYGDKSKDSFVREMEPGETLHGVPLATLLPVLDRMAHQAMSAHSNEYVDALSQVDELLGFSAIVYTAFT
jgi:hypothetical protein